MTEFNSQITGITDLHYIKKNNNLLYKFKKNTTREFVIFNLSGSCLHLAVI